VVAAVAAAAVLMGRGPGAPGRTGTSAAVRFQAASVNSLLSSGTGANGELSAALAAVDDCANLTGSIGELTQIRDQRRSEYEQARAVSVSLLPGAGRLKLDLTRALSYSLRADDAYLGWATRQQQGACQEGSEPKLPGLNRQATSFKNQFAQLWNPIAIQHGLPRRSLTSM
jgi:hypothetical protein